MHFYRMPQLHYNDLKTNFLGSFQGRWKLSQPGQANGSYVANNVNRTIAKFI